MLEFYVGVIVHGILTKLTLVPPDLRIQQWTTDIPINAPSHTSRSWIFCLFQLNASQHVNNVSFTILASQWQAMKNSKENENLEVELETDLLRA